MFLGQDDGVSGGVGPELTGRAPYALRDDQIPDRSPPFAPLENKALFLSACVFM